MGTRRDWLHAKYWQVACQAAMRLAQHDSPHKPDPEVADTAYNQTIAADTISYSLT